MDFAREWRPRAVGGACSAPCEGPQAPLPLTGIRKADDAFHQTDVRAAQAFAPAGRISRRCGSAASGFADAYFNLSVLANHRRPIRGWALAIATRTCGTAVAAQSHQAPDARIVSTEPTCAAARRCHGCSARSGTARAGERVARESRQALEEHCATMVAPCARLLMALIRSSTSWTLSPLLGRALPLLSELLLLCARGDRAARRRARHMARG